MADTGLASANMPLTGGSTTAGATVTQRIRGTSTNQQWRLTAVN